MLDLAALADERIREGRFQRPLVLVAGVSSILSGLEVAYEHYRGSYGNRIMYTPVVLSAALFGASLSGYRSEWAARTVLRGVSILTLADSAVGFYFHARGVQRKPGGWRLPVVNVIMGPPIFAPLLFGTSAYLGLIASYLRRGNENDAALPRPAHSTHWATYPPLGLRHEVISWQQDLREGRFQKHLAAVTLVSSLCSGAEAWYSHYKNNFRYPVQWTPVAIAAMLVVASAGAIRSSKVAHTWLPAISALAIADGAAGFCYHARGVLRRPGGRRLLGYNIMYGPPILAPLLFAACGFIGILASMLRRERGDRSK